MGNENEDELKRYRVTKGQEYLRHLSSIAQNDINVLFEKEKGYKGSWKKRGGIGAFMMLARKWDRMEVFLDTDEFHWEIFKALWEDTRTETILEDIADLRRYLALVEAEFKEQTIRNELADAAHRDMNPEDYCCEDGKCIDEVCDCCKHAQSGCFCPSYSGCPGHGDDCTSQWKKEIHPKKVKGYRIKSVVDENTCSVCQKLDGYRFVSIPNIKCENENGCRCTIELIDEG